MRILGIDPALTILGWGIIDKNVPKLHYVASGLIKSKPSVAMQTRLGLISGAIRDIISEYAPDALSMEITFLNNNANSSLKLAYVRGVVMAVAGELELPYYEYSPNQIKKTLVGAGHAEKQQIKHMIQIVLNRQMDDISFDEADALAAAYTCSAHL